MKKIILLMVVLVAVICSGSVFAQDPIIFPAEGQSNEQMEKDKFECYNWAKGQTGFDPMQMPTASSPPPSQEKKIVGGSTLKGGVVGGAGGAIIGGIAGGSKGAKKGAAIGGLPEAPSAECAALARIRQPVRSKNNGSSSRPTSTCSSEIPITEPIPLASKAEDTP